MMKLKYKTIKGFFNDNKIEDMEKNKIYHVWAFTINHNTGYYTLKQDENNKRKYYILREININKN